MAPAAKYHRRDGAEAMRALLTLPEPPDAVFCFNDLLAVGALRAAAEHGRQVPDDLAVVGFDGSEEGAYTVPTLTTVDPDKAAIAERAVERIAERIAGGPDGRRHGGGGDRHAFPAGGAGEHGRRTVADAGPGVIAGRARLAD